MTAPLAFVILAVGFALGLLVGGLLGFGKRIGAYEDLVDEAEAEVARLRGLAE